MSSERRGGLLIPTDGESAEELAVQVLGWQGSLVKDITLFGSRVSVLARVDEEAHAFRQQTNTPPITDRASVALWEWPELTAPPSVVALSAVMATGARWQQGMKAVSGFAGFSSTVLLLTQDTPAPTSCLADAERYGVWVVRAGSSDTVVEHQGRVGPVATARPTTVTRWTEELVYARLIEDGLVEASPAR
ncbi:hypothetical protein [Amycolatopsis sp. SID8362]|uniref:hypothetical protein n=1 Tax=Amycolatopsis sp. SID8362 TaxID=2690346 RepID=UPI001370FC66|nr:hypothetical protein [Amycolatopsis sp. SID8362]NBH06019.1 hypothetical protein [Amycolatopsis sp. SID8362]NED42717.1 hypothetical protein [Amycolatopsis sp. SID8362]